MLRRAFRATIFLATAAVLVAGRASANQICDLTTAGASCTFTSPTSGGTGLFFQDEQHPTGTGFIDSFLRVQQNTWEQGYNTSDRSYPGGSKMQPIIQDKTDPNFTRDLPLANVGTKTIGGIQYAEFFLDVNEPATTNGSKNLITLDQLEIFASNVALTHPNYDNANTPNTGTGTLTGANGSATKVFDLDTGTNDNWVQIDYNVSASGSGSSDMVFYLPYSYLAGYKYVYLYSEFGDLTGSNPKKYESQAGFEEWWTNSPTPVAPFSTVPEPGSLALVGLGLLAVGRRRLRKRSEPPAAQ